MTVQQTSLEAYEDIKANLGSKQREVYEMLRSLGCANNAILAKKLSWSVNRITPRVLELREKGLVVQDSLRVCPLTKRMTMFWRVR